MFRKSYTKTSPDPMFLEKRFISSFLKYNFREILTLSLEECPYLKLVFPNFFFATPFFSPETLILVVNNINYYYFYQPATFIYFRYGTHSIALIVHPTRTHAHLITPFFNIIYIMNPSCSLGKTANHSCV